MEVTDTFTIAEFPALAQIDFTVTFKQDGAVVTPDYTITNGGGGAYTLAFTPATTGSWWTRVGYSTYKFEQTYEVGPIEPENDIPIQHQTHAKGDIKDNIWSDRITVRDGESHRVILPRVAGKGYSVTVTQEETRGAEISVKKASTFFDIRCKMYDTLAGQKTTMVVEYTVIFWEKLDQTLKKTRANVRRVTV